MKQDETNTKVLAQLQEYAQLYFDAIIETNTKDGKCDLKPGKYSANELTDNSYKSVLGRAWELPCDTMFDEELTVEAGTFQCAFPYRRIFVILARWEAMIRAGKQKAVFEIGNVEEKSTKVLLSEVTELGSYKEKRVKVQRIVGNWWALCKPKKKDAIYLYYELNGVMFIPGKYVRDDSELRSDSTKEWCAKYGDKEMAKLLLCYLVKCADDKEYVMGYGYFEEVARRANITTQSEEAAQQPATSTETPQISTETAEAVECTTESKTAQDAAYMQPHNIEYFAERFGNWQNFNNCYEDATQAVCDELYEYHSNRRKGGSYRRRKMDALQKQLHALNTEWVQLSIVLAEYWGVSPRPPKTVSQSPETPPTANYAAPTPERRQRPLKRPNATTWRHRYRIRQKAAVTAAHQHHFAAAENMLYGKFTARPTYQPITIHPNKHPNKPCTK